MDQDLEKKLRNFLDRQETRRAMFKGMAQGALIALAMVGLCAIGAIIGLVIPK